MNNSHFVFWYSQVKKYLVRQCLHSGCLKFLYFLNQCSNSKQYFCNYDLSQIPNVSQLPPSRSVTSPAKGENSANQGFQRFLNVLNKGVDMDLLSRIVNDDSEDLPLDAQLLNIQLPAVENRSDLPFRNESQQSNSGASLRDNSRTNSEERRTDPPSQERCLSDHLPDNGEKKNDRGALSFGSTSRSRSPPTLKKEVAEKTKVDQQHEQLQNILKTLGLSLEVEEMSKLTNRTQERLYGKKHEDVSVDSRKKQERRHRSFHRSSRKSSSSSSCSSPSRSTSRSISSSPSRRRRSHSIDSRPRQTFEHSGSRDRSRDALTCQDGNQSSKEGSTHMDRDKDAKDTYQHPYSQDQTYPHPHPVAFASFPDSSLSQSSQYNVYHSDSYSDTTNSYWAYTQGTIPPSLYPSGHPCPQNTHHNFPAAVVAPKRLYPFYKDINLLVNPDLSESEGQIGSVSGPRCLQVISIKQTNPQKCLKQLTKPRKVRRGNLENWKKRRRLRRKQKAAAKRKAMVEAVAKAEAEAPHKDEEDRDSGVKQSEEEQPPAEQDIKANLRKKVCAV